MVPEALFDDSDEHLEAQPEADADLGLLDLPSDEEEEDQGEEDQGGQIGRASCRERV